MSGRCPNNPQEAVPLDPRKGALPLTPVSATPEREAQDCFSLCFLAFCCIDNVKGKRCSFRTLDIKSTLCHLFNYLTFLFNNFINSIS